MYRVRASQDSLQCYGADGGDIRAPLPRFLHIVAHFRFHISLVLACCAFVCEVQDGPYDGADALPSKASSAAAQAKRDAPGSTKAAADEGVAKSNQAVFWFRWALAFSTPVHRLAIIIVSGALWSF